MSTVAYIRVSTARQADSGLGLEAQISRIQQFSQLNNIEITETIVDAGISGRTMNREGLQQLLSGVAEGRFTRLIVSSADRLTRSCRDLQTLLHGPLRDVEVICAHVMSGLAEDVEFAETELKEMGRRSSDAYKARRSRGQHHGVPPFGKRVEDGFLVDDEQEQKVIQLIKDRRSLGWALDEIRVELKRLGMTGRRGSSVHNSILSRVAAEIYPALKGHAPFGMRRHKGEFVNDDREQEVIKTARDLRSKGWSCQAVQDELLRLGMHNRAGGPLSLSIIAKISHDINIRAARMAEAERKSEINQGELFSSAARGRPPFGKRAEGGFLVDDEGEQEIIAAIKDRRSRGWTCRAIYDELKLLGMRVGLATIVKIVGR